MQAIQIKVSVLTLSTVALVAQPLPPQCANTVDIDPANAWVQFTHATPWTAEGPIVLGTCPNTNPGGNARCQVSAKIVNENGTNYSGLRLKDADVYSPMGLVHGNNVSIDDGPIVLTFSVLASSTATYGAFPNGDYTLWEIDLDTTCCSGQTLLTPMGANNEFTVTLDQGNNCVPIGGDCVSDVPGPNCGTGYADSGTFIQIATRQTDDVVGASNDPWFETVEIELTGAVCQAPGGDIMLNIGWNDRIRWLIEDTEN